MIKKSILIIDDDIILLKTAEEILSDLYSVSVATVSYTHLVIIFIVCCTDESLSGCCVEL